MRQKEKLIDPVAVDADGIAAAQAVAGAGDLSLNGALIEDSKFTADIPRKIGVLSAGDDSGITFTLTGTDHDSKAVSEALTGSSAAPGTTESTLYFAEIDTITASGAAAGNVSAGTVDEFSTNTIPLNSYNSDPATVSIEAVSGTFDISVEETMSRVQYSDIIYHAGPAALTNISAKAVDEIGNHASGVRLVGNSYTTGAQVTMVINQDNCNS